jgi:ParB family chromosome partitioning protein
MSIVEKLAGTVARAEEARSAGGSTRDDAEAYAAPATTDKMLASILPGQQLRMIPVALISPAREGQARQEFDEERLRTLADSLRRSGVREPIIVTPHGAAAGQFQIVAGERRWRAAKLAGLAEIPCIIDPNLVDRREKLLAQAEENLHRENLNAVEEARVLAQIMDSRNVDVREAGELIGRSYPQARRLYRIHMAIDAIKQAVIRGQLDARGAIEVDRIYNALLGRAGRDEALGRTQKLLERIVKEKWPIRRIEKHAKEIAGGAGDEDGADPMTPRASEPVDRPPAMGTGGTETARQPDGGEPEKAASRPAASPSPTTPRALFTQEGGRVVIEGDRIQRGQVTPEEREQLIAILEDLLMRVRRM